MQQRLQEFSPTQTQFCQNMSQRIGEPTTPCKLPLELVLPSGEELYTKVCVFISCAEEWSSEQEGCVQGIQEGLEGVVSLLRQFSHRQTSGGRQRTRHMQDSLTQSQSDVRQFQVHENSSFRLDVSLFCLLSQENLVSAADGVLTVTLAPFLAGLCSQLALQSSLLTQSTASLREQVSHHCPSLSSCLHCCNWLSLSLYLSIFSCSPTVTWSLSSSVSRTRRSQN